VHTPSKDNTGSQGIPPMEVIAGKLILWGVFAMLAGVVALIAFESLTKTLLAGHDLSWLASGGFYALAGGAILMVSGFLCSFSRWVARKVEHGQ